MSSIQFTVQTVDPLQPRTTQRLPDDCILRICEELAGTPYNLMLWLELEQPHIRWCSGERPTKGLPEYVNQVYVLFIESGKMSYADDSRYRADDHTHLLDPDFSFKRIDA